MFPKEEMIHCDVWKSLCDYEFLADKNQPLPSGLVHVDPQSIAEFFKRIKDNGEKYIVVSSRSDYGLHIQALSPVRKDIAEAAGIFTPADFGYREAVIPPRCEIDNCNLEHKYSIKTSMMTHCTFDEIPENVHHWFLCNNTLFDHPRLTTLPFGVNGTDGAQEALDAISPYQLTPLEERENKVYVNFQFYTMERFELYKYYLHFCEYATAERDVDYATYLDRFNTHKWVLCPEGNGIDSYRIWEALYMNARPVVRSDRGTEFLSRLKLPVIFTGSLFNIRDSGLTCPPEEVTIEPLRLSFWKEKIDAVRSAI